MKVYLWGQLCQGTFRAEVFLRALFTDNDVEKLVTFLASIRLSTVKVSDNTLITVILTALAAVIAIVQLTVLANLVPL